MEDFVIKGNLFELYGDLLKGNQRKVYEYHIMDDMSFTEIGEEMGISRQAAQELFRRADQKLQETERILGLQEKLSEIRMISKKIQDLSQEEAISKLAGEIMNGI